MRRMWAVAAVALAVLSAGAGCGKDERVFGAGTYVGSTTSDRPFKFVVADKPKVNDQKATWDGPGQVRLETLPDKPVMKCKATRRKEEIRCELPTPTGTETIELMLE